MKTAILQTENTEQLYILVKLAEELGISTKVFNSEKEEDERTMTAFLSETSFAKEWNSKEDEHWDELSEMQKKSIEKGIDDADNGRVMSSDDFWKKVKHEVK